MDVSELLLDLFGRVAEHVREAVSDLGPDALHRAPAEDTNSIGWLVWHLTRVEDHHVSELLGEEQIWMRDGWPERFGLTAEPDNTGYGHSPAEVDAVRPDGPDAALGYYTAVNDRTRTYLQGLGPGDLDRIVDERWDPPVTLGVRLISIADDQIQHSGQASYVKGLPGH